MKKHRIPENQRGRQAYSQERDPRGSARARRSAESWQSPVVEMPLWVSPDGRTQFRFTGAHDVNSAGEFFTHWGNGLEEVPGSPVAVQMALDSTRGLEFVNGRAAMRDSDSIRFDPKTGRPHARPTTAQVVDAENPTETAVHALARKANTGDHRFPVLKGISAALVAGVLDVVLATIEADAVVLVNHAVFAGTPGILSAVAVAGVGFTITSSDVLDTSTVHYVVWQPTPP